MGPRRVGMARAIESGGAADGPMGVDVLNRVLDCLAAVVLMGALVLACASPVPQCADPAFNGWDCGEE